MVAAAKGSQSGHTKLERSFRLVSLSFPRVILCCYVPAGLEHLHHLQWGLHPKGLNVFCQDQMYWLNRLVCSSFVGNFRNTADVLLVLSWDDGSGCLQNRRPQVFLLEAILCHRDCSQDDNEVLKTLLTVCSLFHAFLFLLK